MPNTSVRPSVHPLVTYYQGLNRLPDFYEILYTNWLHIEEIVSGYLRDNGKQGFYILDKKTEVGEHK
jgi:hypothetical protein